ncbi:MAG: DUF4349 domain-containing protein [Pyrinomonadaceae bacterium]|nr:DUF4349 domain-containing protein [Pyrinomonadaceae bacterium]
MAQTANDGQKMQTVSLNDADKAQSASVAMERKIVRNADLNLEVSNPGESQRRIASAAEMRGGFVVTSDASQRQDDDRTRPEMTVKIVVRVPAAQFDATVEEIRGVASRVIQEKRTGQDVTEEFIDLEARIRTKRALEAQFLEIMKQAKTVSDALQVQTELAGVRTEIERLEGRRRFLENQASLSTITVMLQSPMPIVSTSGFFYSVKQAFRDGVDLASAITLFLIRAIITLLPLLLFIFLPLALIVRYFIRRMRRVELAQKLVSEEPLPKA